MTLPADIVRWLTDPAHWEGPNGIPARLVEHLGICLAALAIAAVLGLLTGIWVGHTGRRAGLAVNLANFGRALPTFAVMAIVLPVTAAIDPELGFKVYPAIIALAVLAIPPLLVNAYVGISGVDREIVEAGRASGMRERQVLAQIELPLAVPAVFTGIRSATSQVIATATLAAVFGGPGLGRFLIEGLAQQNSSTNGYAEMWSAVILIGALFAVAEGGLALLQRALTSPGVRTEPAGAATSRREARAEA
ncbi:MAG TPA: ABC transporter permease [Candidatus Limnocylindrales bacterium]